MFITIISRTRSWRSEKRIQCWTNIRKTKVFEVTSIKDVLLINAFVLSCCLSSSILKIIFFVFSLSSRLKHDIRSSPPGYQSLPRKSSGGLPRLSFVSVPNTPAAEHSDWEHDDAGYGAFRKRDFTSSSSSVEEAANSVQMKKTRSRWSLNLGVFDGSPASPVKSPNLLPKFLRKSFTKLILGDRLRTPDRIRDEEHFSLPSSSSAVQAVNKENNSNCDHQTTPTNYQDSNSDTQKFVQESLERGLPIIPFPIPTFLIAENNQQANSKIFKKQHRKESVCVTDPQMITKQSEEIKTSTKSKSRVQEEVKKKSLVKLLNEAKHELEQETIRKKVFFFN